MAKNEKVMDGRVRYFGELKKKHQNAILLFRCGDFYEAYYEDAKVVADVLGITLTRENGNGGYMCGFPYHALDAYLPKLIRNGHRVAICDMLPEPPKPKVKRGSTENENKNENNQNSTIMEKNFKAADLIGKTIVVGNNQATIEINGIDGDKLSGVFSKDGKNTPMSFPFSQLKGMIDKGLWKISDGSEEKPTTTDVQTEADVAEVDDIKPVVTKKPEPKPTDEVAEEPDPDAVGEIVDAPAKVEPIKPKKQEKPKKSDKPKKQEPTAKYAFSTYTTKKGKTGAKITGFSEDAPAYARAAELHASASYERDKKGNKVFYLMFGPRYADAAKEVCEALNNGKTFADCKAIIDKATEDRAQKREEWKSKREERRNQTSAISPQTSTEKTYTQSELAEWLRKLNAGDPKAAKFFNDLAKAA